MRIYRSDGTDDAICRAAAGTDIETDLQTQRGGPGGAEQPRSIRYHIGSSQPAGITADAGSSDPVLGKTWAGREGAGRGSGDRAPVSA